MAASLLLSQRPQTGLSRVMIVKKVTITITVTIMTMINGRNDTKTQLVKLSAQPVSHRCAHSLSDNCAQKGGGGAESPNPLKPRLKEGGFTNPGMASKF